MSANLKCGWWICHWKNSIYQCSVDFSNPIIVIQVFIDNNTSAFMKFENLYMFVNWDNLKQDCEYYLVE